MIVVMDPGYSNFKFAFINDETLRTSVRKVPSAVSEIPDWQSESLQGVGESAALEWEKRKYIVGDEALVSGLPIPPFTQGWLESIAIPLFAMKYARGASELIVLLSPADWTLKDKIAENLKQTGFQNLRFMPQGVGVWIEAGAPREAAVIDIGFNTVDVLIAQEGKILRELSFSLKECGLVSFLERVARDDPFRINRRLEDGDPYLTELAKRHYWEWLERQLAARSEWRRLGHGVKLVIGGGGARFLPEAFDRGHVVKEPELANVRGVARIVVKEAKRKRITTTNIPDSTSKAYVDSHT